MPSFNGTSSNGSDFNLTETFNVTDVDIQYTQSVETAPIYLFCCALSLAAISSFLRAGFVLKFIAMLCSIIVQGCVLKFSKLYAFYDHEYDRYDTFIIFFFRFAFFLSLDYYVIDFIIEIYHLFLFVCSSNFGLATTGVFFLILIAIVLHILDRQGDFVARTDFLWKAKLKTEQEEVETMRGINKVDNFMISIFQY